MFEEEEFMRESFYAKHYTLDKIAPHRLEYIDLKLNWLIQLLGLKKSDWPLDFMKIIERIKSEKLLPFDYGFVDCNEDFDAVANYIKEYDFLSLSINKNKVHYPFKTSGDRRLNFTLPHELGHGVLDHLLVPEDAKTEEEKYIEGLEADEFSGRFLLPKWLLFSCNYHSVAWAAWYLNVSKTALWKRLNNMKRLDLLASRAVKSCIACGNTYFSPFAENCGVCGTSLSKGLKGFQKITYSKHIKFDKYNRAISCPACNSQNFKGDKCAICGTYIFNFCSDYLTNFESGCNHTNPSNNRYCEMCGRPTYYYKRGLLCSWQDEINAKI
jgi:Zn-dependent peptidase ImmA (M78 family)